MFFLVRFGFKQPEVFTYPQGGIWVAIPPKSLGSLGMNGDTWLLPSHLKSSHFWKDESNELWERAETTRPDIFVLSNQNKLVLHKGRCQLASC